MLRLRRFLKPYILLFLLAIILLFIQANADLALPDYLSKIVNNGIQQNGVENAVPEVIRQNQMEKAILFMSEEEQASVLESYELVEPGSTAADQYLETYPVLESEPVYILQDVDQDQVDAMNTIFGKAFVVLSGIERMMEDPTQAPFMGEDIEFDPTMLPPGMDLFDALSMMPAEQRGEFSAAIDEGIDAGFLGAHAFEGLGDLLGLPPHVEPVGIITLGHARDRTVVGSAARPRLSRGEVVRYDRWADS